MANSVTHAALPYPIKNARYTLLVPYLDADGDPTDPTTPDTEVSGDAGAFADCAEEVTTISGTNGMGYITLTGAETNYSLVALAAKVASGPKNTLATLYPRVLASVGTGTLSAGSAGGGTLGTVLAYDLTGCFIQTTGGTGGGGTGGANNQARRIMTYNTGTGAFTVTPNWETTPDATTTYSILLPEGVTLGMLKTLNPTTAGRTLDVSTGGEAGLDWANIGTPTTTVNLSGTTIKTATDVETDTQDIQNRIPAALTANGNMKADTLRINGTAQTAADLGAINVTNLNTLSADSGLRSVRSNTAQAGATNTITLDASASATNQLYRYQRVYLTGGTGAGQDRIITDYNGTSKVATVTPDWVTNPASDTTFSIRPNAAVDTVAFNESATDNTNGYPNVQVSSYASSARPLMPNDSNYRVQVGTDATVMSTMTKVGPHGAATAQTARDIGLSVLISSGTGTGQLNVTNGVVNANTVQAAGVTWTSGAITANSIAASALNGKGDWATASQVSGLSINTRANLSLPSEIETPDASTQVYKIRLHLFDVEGNMEAPDSTPTISLTNAAGTDRSSRLSSASNPSTGVYVWDYTATVGDAEEQLIWVFTVIEGGLTRTYPATSYVVEESAYRFSSSDRANLVAILADTNELQTDWVNGGRLDNILDARASQTSVDTIDGIVDNILVDTTEIGVAGAGLTNVPWNASWDAEVESEVTDALNAYDPPTNTELEARTLASANYATATNLATANTALAKLDDTVEDNSGTWRFTAAALVNAPTAPTVSQIADEVQTRTIAGVTLVGTTTNLTNLPAIPNNWITAAGITASALNGKGDWNIGKTGYSLTSGERTAIANEVEAQIIDETDSEKVLTAITDKIAAVNPSLSGLTLAAIASQVRTELTTELGRIDVAVSTRLATSGYTAPDNTGIAAIQAVTDAITGDGSGLTAIPWNTAWDAEVQSEVTDALNAYDPPTNAEMEARTLVAANYATAANLATANTALAKLDDTVEDNAGTYRFTAAALVNAPTGGSAPTASQIADEVQTRTIAAVTTVGTTTNLTNLPAIPNNWITATGITAAALNGKGDWNIGKTGYTLTQAFPANFPSLIISGAGIVSANVSDKTGFSLTTGERTAIANEVEAQIIDETDSEKVLTAITDKIASVNPSLEDLTLAAIASAVRTELTTELGRIDVTVSSRASQVSVDDLPTNSELSTALGTADDAVLTAIGSLNNLSQAQAASAALSAITSYGPSIPGSAMTLTAGERTTLTASIWGYVIEGAITGVQTMRAILAFILGKTSGAGTSQIVFRDTADTKDRIILNVNSVGERSASGGDLT